MRKYSAMEEMLLVLLKQQKSMTTSQLVTAYYKGRLPKFPRNSIAYVLRGLQSKLLLNKSSVSLRSTPLRGPHDMEFWLENV